VELNENARQRDLVPAPVPPLLVVALFDALALVLRQALPPVPFVAQVFFILLRQSLPALIIFQYSVFLGGR